MTKTVEEAVQTYAAGLVKLAFTYVKNMADAEDVVQDVFLTLTRKTPLFLSEEHEKAWLIRVTINQSLNCLRSYKNRRESPLPDDLSYLPEEEEFLLDEVLKLPEKYRTVLHLYYYEDYTIPEIAKMLDRTVSTVGCWLARGRKQLKQAIGE